MSSQAFEILCPICRSVVPLDAPSCPTCARNRVAAANLPETPRGAAVAQPQAAKGAPAPGTEPLVAKGAPDLRSLSLKDYHRVVRASYVATEGPSAGSSRIRSYLPFALLVLLLILGAAVIFGHMP